MIARQPDDLNTLTDQLLRRGLAMTKMDARRLAESMLKKDDEEAQAIPTPRRGAQRIVGIDNPQDLTQRKADNPFIEKEEAQPQNNEQIDRLIRIINTQQDQITQLQEHVQNLTQQHKQVHEEHAQLHQEHKAAIEEHHSAISSLKDRIKQLIDADVKEEKEHPAVDGEMMREAVESDPFIAPVGTKEEVTQDIKQTEQQTPRDRLEAQAAEEEIGVSPDQIERPSEQEVREKNADMKEATVDLGNIFNVNK